MKHRQAVKFTWFLMWSMLLGIGEVYPLQAESILDFADAVISETEENDTQPQDLSGEFAGEVQAVGVSGTLAGDMDVDKFKVTLAVGGKMQLKFQPLGDGISSLAAGEDNRGIFISNNNVWRQSEEGSAAKAELLITKEQIAAALGVEADAVQLADLAYQSTTGIILLAEQGSQSILSWAEADIPENSLLAVAVAKTAILAATGETSANLAALATDAAGAVYAADQASGSVLKISSDFSTVSVYTAGNALNQAFEEQVREDFSVAKVALPTTVLAQTTGLFMANAVAAGSGAYGGDFYVTQLSEDNNGTGGITKITVNEEDPNSAAFEAFFDPDASQSNLDPSALALDTSESGTFGNKMYMGTFGASMGDDFDGTVYQVSESGEITPFITSFVDGDGIPATFGDKAVTGFFDVTDLAFSSGGAFGDYLYVISENIDSNGTAAGGYQSDIWRVDPNGKAELFVPDIADGAIALAFGNSRFDGDLFVGTFSYGSGGAVIYRVDSEGNVETFFDFNQYSSQLSVCDMAFSPEDSEFGGDLIITMKSGSNMYVVSFAPDGSFLTWSSALNGGDVSSGDLVFDASENLVIAMGGDKSLIRVDYQGTFDYQMEGLEVRAITTTGDEGTTTAHVPYALLKNLDTFWLFRLSDSGEPSDLTAELGPSELNNSSATEDDPREAAFAFDGSGNLYVYVQNREELTKYEQEEEDWGEGTTVLTQSQIDEATGLTDARLYSLACSSDGRLMGIGRNGTTGEETDTAADDKVLKLGNTTDSTWEAEEVVGAPDLSQMTVSVSGPDSYEQSYPARMGEILDQTMDPLAAGEYTITIQSSLDGTGAYELLVNLGGELEATLVADDMTSPLYFSDTQGQNLVLSCIGGGRAELHVTQRPSGAVISMSSLTLAGTGSKTEVFLGTKSLYETKEISLETMTLAELSLEEITLDGSLKSLVYPGTAPSLKAAADSKGTVRSCLLGSIESVDAEAYSFGTFSAIAMGSASATKLPFTAKELAVLEVKENLQNVRFFTSLSRNRYDSIRVGGILGSCIFYGTSCGELEVSNSEDEDNAVENCTFTLTGTNSFLQTVLIRQGTVIDTTFRVGRSMKKFEIQNGNLTSSTIMLTDTHGKIDEILIGRSSTASEEGNMESSSIYSHKMGRIRADGDIFSGTQIRADVDILNETEIRVNNSLSSKIDKISCGGNFGGTAIATRIWEVLVGYDRDGKRKEESTGYSGSDLTGTVTATYRLDTVSVTGKIDGGSLSCLYKHIQNIFVEDGLIDGKIFASNHIRRILVGYIGGQRGEKWIANSNADVSGTISAKTLGRLYYTGTLDPDTVLPAHRGPVRDDVK